MSNISPSMATMTADLQPASGPVGGHVRYDEDGFENAWGFFDQQTLWVGSRVLNDTGLTSLEGIDTYIADPGGATLDISFYESMAGGPPTNLIYSETGIAATSGWNRVIFQTAQDFPDAAERGIVVKIVTDGIDEPEYLLAVDDKRFEGTCSGRSYINMFDGVSQFDELCGTPFVGDLNLVALFGDAGVAPEFDSTPVPGTPLAFGEVQIDATSGELFATVDNIGTAGLTLSCAITGTNADQFNVVACPAPVAAEGSVQLSVTCSPDSSGEKTASLDVATNDADEPNVSYPLTCTGVESMPDVIHNHGFEDNDAPGA